MFFRYPFPLVTSKGYGWHLLYKCFLKVGKWPASVNTTDSETVVMFDRELTDSETAILNDIMKDPEKVLDPIEGAAIFEIKDLYETLDEFNAEAGTALTIWFMKSDESKIRPDRILLISEKKLLDKEVEKVMSTYAGMIKRIK